MVFFQVAHLKQRLISPTGLTGDKNEAEPASGFLVRAEKIWKTIKDNKDLDLPALKVYKSLFMCEYMQSGFHVSIFLHFVFSGDGCYCSM